MAKFNGFKGDYKGLNTEEIIASQTISGFNELTPEKKETFFHKAIQIFKQPMFSLLLFTSLIYFVLGEPQDGFTMLIFVVFMSGINIFQEWRTDKTLQALKELSSPKTKVIRNEELLEIESREVTMNDLIIITEGDQIPADGIIIEMFDLGVNESTLTGESDIVWKKINVLPAEDNEQWHLNYCYTGTSVTQGSAIIKVIAIGAQTEYGKIGTALLETKKEATPLEKQVNKLIVTFAIIGLLFSVLAMIATYLNTVEIHPLDKITQSILAGVTLAMALIPEEFPVILTVFLAMGAWRLAKKNSLIRKMPSVETLGAVTVLCVDKTGTLTKNKMTVQEVYYHTYKESDFLTYSALSCETEPYDPMEKAILKFAFANGVNKDNVFNQKLISEYSFSSETKMMGHVWEINNQSCLAVKGSPESVLPLCELSPKELKNIENKQQVLALKGYRVIAVAKKLNLGIIPENLSDNRLELLGLIGLEDPPREAVPNAIKTCYKAGLRVIMITGDNAITAGSIASKIGIKNPNQVLTEVEINTLTDEQLRERVKTTSIFARVIPSQKMRIVKALKDNGEIVAMTGDGVNDATALKYSDIGIAMGRRGTNVAKEASDMVLLDDDFTTIVDTIKDGRRIYDNIKKAVGYILVIHIPIALIALLSPALGIPLMLLPIHIVLLELIIDPTCSIIFERQPAEKDIMARKPRSVNESLINKGLLFKALTQGLAIFIASFGSYMYLLDSLGWEVTMARTFALVVLIMSSLFLVYVNHSDRNYAFQGLFLNKDKVILLVNTSIVTMLLFIMYTSYGNSIAKTTPLSLEQLLAAIFVAVVATFWWELIKVGKNFRNSAIIK